MREQFSGLCKMRRWHESNYSVHRYLQLHANTGSLGGFVPWKQFMMQRDHLLSRTARLQLSNSGCREDLIFIGSALFVENIYMLIKKRQETMCLPQKIVPTLGCRVTSLYLGPGNTKFSHTRWNSFQTQGWENILYPGHYSMQQDYRSS